MDHLALRMKKKKRNTEKFVEEVASDVDDTDLRPASSPYASPSVDVYFGKSGCVAKIPKDILSQSSKLSPKIDSWGSITNELRLDNISEGVGHILLHYLFTGRYQCLKPIGVSPQEKNIAEYETSIQAYSAARTYELGPLVDLAKSEIERLGDTLDLGQVLAAAEKAYTNPDANDTWFIRYLQSRSEALFTGEATLQSFEIQQTPEDKRSISGIVLEVIVKSIIEKTHHALVMPDVMVLADATGLGEIVQSNITKADFLSHSDSDSNVDIKGDSFAATRRVSPDRSDAAVHSGDDCVLKKRKKKSKKKKGYKGKRCGTFDEVDCASWEDHMNSGEWKVCEQCLARLLRLSQEIDDL